MSKPNKVYVITKGRYSDKHIIGIASTFEKANSISSLFDESNVSEWVVDDIECIGEENKPLWVVDTDNWDAHIFEGCEYEWWVAVDHRPTGNELLELECPKAVYAIVCAETEEQAVKIAQDLYAEHKATEKGVKL